MEISVVVPSYGRPEALALCLAALESQSRPADEVVVVTRRDDARTRELLAGYPGLPLAERVVEVPGQVQALDAGVRAARGDVVAITDDDAAPRPRWLEQLERWFSDPTVIGAGGRDAVAGVALNGGERVVGRVRWCGKVVGNHHLGVGEPRDVDVLKGANMAFRREPLLATGFDLRLKGAGAQVHNDLKLSLALRRAGGRLVYDPGLLVDHMPAPRPQGDDRRHADPRQQVDAVHNETLALLEYLPPARRTAFVAWALAVGRDQGPGLAHAAWTAIRRHRGGSLAHLRATLRGRLEGWRTYRRSAVVA
ncbi:MAG TPA: glycosyltransferase [Solirubrobacterales bacterium]|nr:glycosyltransferase [Solirubrobacterales bacterium]